MMKEMVYNFGAGPAMLPVPVMQKIQREWLDYQGMGVSVIEISHRCEEFGEILDGAQRIFRQLTGLPDNYKILFAHGGARMQFAAIPMNFAGLAPARKCLYVDSGNFAALAAKEAMPLCDARILASTADSNYHTVPQLTADMVDSDASYVHITSNNTIYTTRWHEFPQTGDVPLIADMTSELLSRRLDYNQFGVVYAGLQKNLGPAGMAMVIVREDLLGRADVTTPTLLNYAQCAKDNSLTNTTNTFAVYAIKLMLEWLRDEGGIDVIEQRNNAKATLLYDLIDESDFYRGVAHADHRSVMNVSFNLPTPELETEFLADAEAIGLYALKGHRSVGGIRASIYNPMPVAGVEKLATFMTDFRQRKG